MKSQVEDEQSAARAPSMGPPAGTGAEFHLRAPMPGLVVAVPVRRGQEVKKGAALVILEFDENAERAQIPRTDGAGTCGSNRAGGGARPGAGRGGLGRAPAEE